MLEKRKRSCYVQSFFNSLFIYDKMYIYDYDKIQLTLVDIPIIFSKVLLFMITLYTYDYHKH